MFKYVHFEVLCSSEILMSFHLVLNCVCEVGGAEGGDGVKSFCCSHNEKLDEWTFAHLCASL